MSLEKMWNMYHGPDTNVSNGPKTILYDLVRSMRWELLTHAGFLTYGHHNTDGQATWITPHSGAQIWIVILPKDTNDSPATIDEYYSILDKLLPDLEAIPDRFNVFTILVKHGQTL